ncbi:hypothetical protein ACFL0O_00870 [Thermodesulfobacteriota bacterium]
MHLTSSDCVRQRTDKLPARLRFTRLWRADKPEASIYGVIKGLQ